MTYLITFLEGLVTFLSPCLLPMLPIYLSYFAGGDAEEAPAATLKHALGFVLGFTITFLILGAFAGTIGLALQRHTLLVNLICGGVVVVFGLNYLGLLRLNLFRGGVNFRPDPKHMGFFPAVLFGMVFSIGWTPCVGAFLGSALMLASQQGSVLQGVLLLLAYSLGLGVPFLLSAVLIGQLKSAFGWIKAHYDIINRVSGVLLVLLGLAMMTGLLNRLLTVLA